MKLNVNELQEGETKFVFKAKKDELGFNKNGKEEIKMTGVVSIFLKVHKIQDRIVSFGSISSEVELICGRCLEPYMYHLSTDFEVEYRKRISTVQSTKARLTLPAFAQETEEVETGVVEYTGDFIDITDDIRQNIVLVLPLKPLCKAECKGLCSICGANLNLKECDDKHETGNLSALNTGGINAKS